MKSDLLVALASFFFGAFVTRWWNRARPLVVLHGFSEIFSSQDMVDYPEEAYTLSKTSWTTGELPSGAVSLGQLNRAYESLMLVTSWYESGIDIAKSIIDQMKTAKDDDQTMGLLKTAMINRGISSALSIALQRDEIKLEYDPASFKTPKLPIVEPDGPNGAFLIVWKDSTSTFAEGIDNRSFLKPRLKPMVEAMKYLNRPTIKSAFDQVVPLMKVNIEENRRFIDLVAPVVNARGRWTGRVLLANYGAAPMMLWPEGAILVRHKESHAKFEIPAYLAHETENGVQDVDGVFALAPGEKVWVWVISNDPQQDMKSGSVLRGHYSEGDAEAAVKLKITRRGNIFDRWTKSPFVVFNKSELKNPGS